jgi:hypothetical protein
MEKSKLEAARNAYITQVLEWRQPQMPETTEYIYQLEQYIGECEHYLRAFHKVPPVTDLRSYALSKKPLMQVSDSGGEGGPATVDENVLLATEELAQPLTPSTTGSVEVHRKPKPLFDASSVESGEQFSGLSVEESRGGHVPPKDIDSLQYLIDLITDIELDMTNAFIHREKSINSVIDGTITAVISAVNKERIRVVSQFAATLREKISASRGF